MMDPDRRTKAIAEHAMACAGATKAVSEAREALARGGDHAAIRAVIRQLWLEMEERQQRMQALMTDGKTQGRE
jgi:hypothetical protein